MPNRLTPSLRSVAPDRASAMICLLLVAATLSLGLPLLGTLLA